MRGLLGRHRFPGAAALRHLRSALRSRPGRRRIMRRLPGRDAHLRAGARGEPAVYPRGEIGRDRGASVRDEQRGRGRMSLEFSS